MNRIKDTLLRLWNSPVGLKTTHFWGPAANWGIVLAGLADVNRDADKISGTMTTVMCVYSALFMRFALKVQPKNVLLFSCHACNEVVQLYTLSRLINYEMNKDKELVQGEGAQEQVKA